MLNIEIQRGNSEITLDEDLTICLYYRSTQKMCFLRTDSMFVTLSLILVLKILFDQTFNANNNIIICCKTHILVETSSEVLKPPIYLIYVFILHQTL